jgi:beta-hydroxylase
MRAIRRLRPFLARQSLVGDPTIFDPAAFPFVADLEANWRAIRRELDAVLETRERLPPLHNISPDAARISDDRWNIFLFYGFGARSERNLATCPETARLLSRVPGIQNAWFSIIDPDFRIPSHRGITKSLLRCHLGLIVPEGRGHCRMRIGGLETTWEEGRCLIIDDTVRHSVWNATGGERAVLLVDFERPMRLAGRIASQLFLAGIRRHGYYRDAMKNQRSWEEKYYGGDPAAVEDRGRRSGSEGF